MIMSKKKKDSNKKSNSKRSRSIVIVDDTLPISLVRSNVLTSVMNNEEIKNLIIYNKKGKEKLLEGLKDKTVCFKLHTSYELRDKNGAKVEPEIVNKDSGFASYKIKMKSFLNTIKADLIEKDYWTRTHYDENKFGNPVYKLDSFYLDEDFNKFIFCRLCCPGWFIMNFINYNRPNLNRSVSCIHCGIFCKRITNNSITIHRADK